MNALRRVLLAAAAVASLHPLLAQTSPKPPIAGCGVVTDPPVAPQIRLQTPPGSRDAVRSPQGRGASSGAGPTVIVPAPPAPPWPACAADIGAAISGDGIAPGAVGVAMNLLGDGFHLTSIALATVCGAAGGSPVAVPVLQTSWSVDGADSALQLSQQPQADSSPNRLDAGSATFWWHGYLYSLAAAGAVPVASGGTGATTGGTGPDDARAILLHAIAELAPGLDLSCFAERKAGAWSDLDALGIGDPRPAIPSGYALSDFQLTFLAAPACAAPAPDTEVVLSATFQSAAGGSIGIGAWSLDGSDPYPGTLEDGLVAWSSDRYQFSVWGSAGDGTPLSSPALVAIARALDPAFSAACALQPVVLSPGDLDALGFHAPAAPAGYALTFSSLTGDVVGSACTRTFSFGGTYSLFWTFANAEGSLVAATAFRVVSGHPGPRTAPAVSDSCISWSDDRGTSFFVSGNSVSGGPGPGIAALIGVARSMDPGLVISN